MGEPLQTFKAHTNTPLNSILKQISKTCKETLSRDRTKIKMASEMKTSQTANVAEEDKKTVAATLDAPAGGERASTPNKATKEDMAKRQMSTNSETNKDERKCSIM